LKGSQLNPSLWERAQQVFCDALTIAPGERASFVRRECAGDPHLLEEVESLLTHDMGEAELEDVFQVAAAALVEESSAIGQRIGAYRIRSELGHGGMGTVYLAVRADDEFHKQVAIKVVKKGMDTRAMLERFRYERQILANLDHPYIARLMDGGSTAGHQPYFVMEYVEGRPIDAYCRERQLPVKDVCRLFLKVCEAVSYAHRNLVVHRDLKPSNMIVTAEGSPKLLDFGVAKLLSLDPGADATVTGVFQRPLTPEYASPEQVRGLAVSTATDVYSLGAVLYELLTGSRIHSMASSTPSEWQKMVCEEEVARPSLRRRELRGDLDNILLMALRKEPERRYSSVEQLASDIEGFLDGRPVLARHDSVRYRAGKYVRRHRVGIVAAGLVAASLLVGVVLALAEARDARAARRVAEQERALADARARQADAARLVAEHEHLLAEQQRQLAEESATLAKREQKSSEQRLTQMLQIANKSLFDVYLAIERLPGATPARQKIVNTTLAYLESLEKEAGADLRLQMALGSAYLRIGELQGSPNQPSLGDTVGAMKSLDKAAAWIAPVHASHGREANVLAAWIDINRARAEIFEVTGRGDQAVTLVKSLLPDAALLTRISPGDGREPTMHQNLVSLLSASHPEEAIEHARLGVAGYTRLIEKEPLNADTVLALSAVHSLWGSALRATDRAEAMTHYRESVRLREELTARYPQNVAVKRGLMLAYGQTASALGDSFMVMNGNDVEGARGYYEKAAVIAHDLANADPMNRLAQYDVASVELRLGALDPKSGGTADSLAGLERAAAIFERLAAGDAQAVRYRTGLNLAYEYIGKRMWTLGKRDEALAAFGKSLAVSEATLKIDPQDSPANIGILSVEQSIAEILAEGGDRAEALQHAGRALAAAETMAKKNTLSSRLRLAQTYEAMARLRKQLGDWAEARTAATRSAQIWKGFAGDKEPHTEDLARAEGLVAECEARLR